ncbi:MAG: DUF4982 domain-containing protein [Bacteroidales bacterium]|nr:DUF4982 domain-containing protein [Bacteroidales bacterium]
MKKHLVFVLLLMAAVPLLHAAPARRVLFDAGWKFMEIDLPGAESPSWDDSGWTEVDLPHDWDIAHSPSALAASGNDGGYYPGGTGWYRKSFPTPAAESVRLHFEGVYQRSEVYVNGKKAGTHAYGYTPFTVDITSFLSNSGNNVVAVRVDNSLQPNCRWYSGSGIYRHVWLETSDALRIAENGIFVTTPEVSPEEALVKVSVSVSNESVRSRKAAVSVEGQTRELMLPAGGTAAAEFSFRIGNPDLWSPEHPALYRTAVTLVADGQVLDRQTVRFGVRCFSFDAESGFVLNGRKVLLNGACVHHDDGLLGAAAFDASEFRKVRLMKEAGFNLIRTSHNPSTRAMLDACDSLGMLVIDEAFDGWREAKTRYDYSTLIDSCYREDIAAMVLRDRNHPSVICWSIGNEVIERRTIDVVTTARNLRREVLRHDGTRPVTEALCSWDPEDKEWPLFDPHAEALDILGYNYMIHKHAEDHERLPGRVMWQTESYPRDVFDNWSRTYTYPYIVGDIVWTGLDYLGESGIGRFYYEGDTPGEHYQGTHFPWHGAYCGDVDITGWRKPVSHYRDMLWNPDSAPILYMAVQEPDGYHGRIRETKWSVWPTWESWNWPGWEGRPVKVEVYTHAPSVRLFLDNREVGSARVDRSSEFKAVFDVPYAPGTLRAVAMDASGKVTGEVQIQTAGKPARLRLTPEKKVMTADGQDLVYVLVEVVDRQGRVVPDAAVPAEVSVSGPGCLMAAGSADMTDTEPLPSSKVTTWHGRAMIVVRSGFRPGKIRVEARSSLPANRVDLQTRMP